MIRNYFCVSTLFQIEYVRHSLKDYSITFKFRWPSQVDALLYDVVVTKIQEFLNVLCIITVHIPDLNKKSIFLGNNAFLVGDLESVIHMIASNSENKDLRWCIQKYYKDEKRVSEYNQLVNLIVLDDRLSLVRETLCQVKRSPVEVMDHTILHSWCSNTRRKIKAGV